MLSYKDSFVIKMADILPSVQLKNIKPENIIAIASLESNWGRSGLVKNANNLFSITKGNWPGEVFTARDWRPGENGEKIYYNIEFRKYKSWEESISDFVNLITKSTRYKALYNALINESDGQKIGELIISTGYATAPYYPASLKKILPEVTSIYKNRELKKKAIGL